MRKLTLAAALVAVVLPMTPAMAREMNGYTVRSTVMRAGPDYDYPVVLRLRANAGVTVYGCLRNWDWCDVGTRYDRGWVRGRDLVVNYGGRRRGISANVGLGILSFVFGSYWDSHYRSRPFYSERPRWEQQYTNRYRPEWGPRPTPPTVTPQYRPRVDQQPRQVPHVQPTPRQTYAPTAPRSVPQVQPGANNPQHKPNQGQGGQNGRGGNNRGDNRAAPGQDGKDHNQHN